MFDAGDRRPTTTTEVVFKNGHVRRRISARRKHFPPSLPRRLRLLRRFLTHPAHHRKRQFFLPRRPAFTHNPAREMNDMNLSI